MHDVIALADVISYELEYGTADLPDDVSRMLSRAESALRKLYHNMEVINKWVTEADKDTTVYPAAAIAVIGVMSDLGQFTKEKGSDAGNS